MESRTTHAVTGAFGYTGKYIARRLLDKGHTVLTLTHSPHRENPFGSQIAARPFHFSQPARLVESLKRVSVLYNTYWVRFNHRLFTHADAVKNTLILFECAQKAGVERVVHVSITNPSLDSNLEYFRGKAVLEQTLRASGMSFAILRPAVLFGREDILINNIAWALRKFPVFGMFGRGEYRIQPIHVDDLAALAAASGETRDNCIINAVGPETFTYRELVQTIGRIIGRPRPVIPLPSVIGYAAAAVIGHWVGDVFLTWEEVKGLSAGLLAVKGPPAGITKLTDWAARHAATLGMKYASELARRKNRTQSYTAI